MSPSIPLGCTSEAPIIAISSPHVSFGQPILRGALVFSSSLTTSSSRGPSSHAGPLFYSSTVSVPASMI